MQTKIALPDKESSKELVAWGGVGVKNLYLLLFLCPNVLHVFKYAGMVGWAESRIQTALIDEGRIRIGNRQ